MPVICKKEVKRKLPSRKAAVEVLSAGGYASLRQASGGREKLVVSGFPLTQTRKGGCIMELNEVLALLTIIGGTVYVTFQISWAIFKEIHNNKK